MIGFMRLLDGRITNLSVKKKGLTSLVEGII